MWILTLLLLIVGVVAKCRCEITAQQGDTIVMKCYVPTSTRNSSPVRWNSLKFDKFLNKDHRITVKANLTDNLLNRISVIGEGGNYNLKIINVTHGDAGNYSCGYKNYKTNEWITVETNIIRIPLDYPVCATEPSDIIYPGMEVRLVCISPRGARPATLTWYRKGLPLRTTLLSNEFQGYHERTLQEEDNGVRFVCKTTSPDFNTPRECSVTPLRLISRVRIYTSQYPVTVGEDVEFKCLGKGLPAISSYFWYWNGELITRNNSDRLIIGGDNGQKLTLLSTQQYDNDALILCRVETITKLQKADHIRLTLQNSNSSYLRTSTDDIGPGERDTTDCSLSSVAVFGGFIAGIAISLIAFCIIKATFLHKLPHYPVLFNKVSLSSLYNFGHQKNAQTTRSNRTVNNKTSNFSIIHLVPAVADDDDNTEYHDVQDNRSSKHSISSDHNQMEQVYTNPDFIDSLSQACCERDNSVASEASEERGSPSDLDDSLYAVYTLSDQDFSKEASPIPKIRSHSLLTKTNFQWTTQSMMPKILEDSHSPLAHKRKLSVSLPDLSHTRVASMPIIINHDYVNMDAAKSLFVNSTLSSEIPDYHGYVNYKGSGRNTIVRSDSSSSGHCEDLDGARPTPKVRSQTMVAKRKSDDFQRLNQPIMPQIREDSDLPPNRVDHKKYRTVSLPELNLAHACFSSVPMTSNHDYVNMNVAATLPDSSKFSSKPFHDYVNFKTNRRNTIARSDCSSIGYWKESEPGRLISASPRSHKLRYAELDFPDLECTNQKTPVQNSSAQTIAEQSPLSESEQSNTIPVDNSPKIPYAQIAYVFKDRRQQREPSVKRNTVTR